MSRHQTGELQGLPLSDGVHPLCVSLLLNVTGVSWVDDADSRRSCGGRNTECVLAFSILLISEGRRSLAGQIVYWLRGRLTGPPPPKCLCLRLYCTQQTRRVCTRKHRRRIDIFYFHSFTLVQLFKHCVSNRKWREATLGMWFRACVVCIWSKLWEEHFHRRGNDRPHAATLLSNTIKKWWKTSFIFYFFSKQHCF